MDKGLLDLHNLLRWILLILLLLSGLATLKIGIFAIFGAFMFGVCLAGHARRFATGCGDLSFANTDG